MGIVSVVVLVILVIACALLVLVVLLQDEQGEGLGGLFAGSGASFGPRKGNVLTRFTSILGIVFMIGAFAVAWLNRSVEVGDVVRRARLEQLKTGQQSDWWVESGTLKSGGQTEATQQATGSGAQRQGSGAESSQTSNQTSTQKQ